MNEPTITVAPPAPRTAITEPVQAVAATQPQSEYYQKPKTVPAGWEGFHGRSQEERLDAVTKQMDRGDSVDPALYAFLKAELFNRNHWNVTRNNIANILTSARDEQNRHPDPDLCEAFITMLEDETEDTVWRDYCLQFLSGNLAHAFDPERVRAVIAKYAKGTDSLAGTAMLHPAQEGQASQRGMDDAVGDQLAETLEKPETHPDTRLTILGLMGRHKDIRHLELIRKYARQDEDAPLKRTAIAALGSIGASPDTRDSITEDDKRLIEAALKHKNGAVQMVAKAALKKISADVP